MNIMHLNNALFDFYKIYLNLFILPMVYKKIVLDILIIFPRIKVEEPVAVRVMIWIVEILLYLIF